jgi:hypothetical protein
VTQTTEHQPTTAELRSQIASQRTELGQDLEALGDHLSPRRMVERRKAAMSRRMHSARDRVMGTAEHAAEAASGVASDAASTLGEAPQAVRRQVEGNPLAAGLLALAGGLVVAALLPETERERQMAERIQPGMEGVAAEIGEAAHETAEHLKPAAKEAAAQVKDQARESAEELQRQAREAAGRARTSGQPGETPPSA